MNGADQIRQYTIDKYIKPARVRHDYVVGILSGDIHDALGSQYKYSHICAALGSDTFEHQASVSRIALLGPVNGRKTLFVYQLT